jgi:hypothetical protein
LIGRPPKAPAAGRKNMYAAAGRPTRFVPIDPAALAEWSGWGAARAP